MKYDFNFWVNYENIAFRCWLRRSTFVQVIIAKTFKLFKWPWTEVIIIYNTSIIICREYKRACWLSWIIFASYEIFIHTDRHLSPNPLCPHIAEGYGYFYTFSHVSFTSGFAFTSIILIAKILRSRSEIERRVPNIIAFNIAFMSLVTAILDLSPEWGGICIDALG